MNKNIRFMIYMVWYTIFVDGCVYLYIVNNLMSTL